MPDRDALLRSLPGVDETLQAPEAEGWFAFLPRDRVAGLVRSATAEVRSRILEGRLPALLDLKREVKDRVGRAIDALLRSSLRPVINASGVILHTNLGRAPLGPSAVKAIVETAGRYSNLEYDIGQGSRGRRDDHCGQLLRTLLGSPAIVVNNNAAAIFLVLSELARGGEVIVSRGELIEIGDGFRVPEIMEASQATLREVGTTNRTGLDDYRNAIGPGTKALVRVHPSNFRQVGFTGRPSLRDLAALASEASVPLVEDLGSGCLGGLEGTGIEREPPVTDSLAAGVDLVTFSGDKLLGGPQAGIIAGKPALVERVRRNPLFRALRVGKLNLAALAATLRCHVAGRPDDVPALAMSRLPVAEVTARARRFVRRLAMLHVDHVETVPGESLLGGGSTPMQGLPTTLVAIRARAGGSARRMESALRANDPPVVARIEKDRLLLDLRTVQEAEEDDLLGAVLRAAGERPG